MNLAVTGHRPQKIGGYDESSSLRTAIRRAIRLQIEVLQPDYGLTGMALGVDQDFAQVCIDLGVPFIAAVPFAGQESRWPEPSQQRFTELLSQAHDVVVVSPGPYAAWKMQKRNQWLVNQASALLAVWDGSDGGTANCVAYAAKKKLTTYRIDPKSLQLEEDQCHQ
jgi:uncharacterized phage-like protein YoqJ